MAMIAITSLRAQSDSSLTRLFDGMSAKERSRIAKQEQEDALQDAAYQAAMEQADALFRERRYEEALAGYQAARRMRPYNVYPKVKIQDLQALLEREAAASKEVTPDPVVEETVPVPTGVPDPPARTAVPVEDPPGPAAVPVVETPVEVPVPARREVPADRPKPRPKSTPPVAASTPALQAAPDSMEERVFKEGRSVVVERTVVEEGRTTIYRKVLHPWGGSACFKDAVPISDRAWEERFGQ